MPVQHAEEDTAYFGESWDDGEMVMDENDPDAIVCMQFEESLVDALQGDVELAACYNTYVDARKRLQDRNKNRGFWGNAKGYQKGKNKMKSKPGFRPRKPLAQRILESECRRCGQKGHWKAECPLNRTQTSAAPSSSGPKDSAFAGATMTMLDDVDADDMILISGHEDVPVKNTSKVSCWVDCFAIWDDNQKGQDSCAGLTTELLSRFTRKLKSSLSPRLKNRTDLSPFKIHQGSIASEAQLRPISSEIPPGSCSDVMFVSHGPFGIVDLGASQTVIGQQQIPELLNHLPEDIRSQVKRVPCSTVFRFGNSSTVPCHEALLVPLMKWHVKICIVPSRTPFLLSNNVFRTLGAQIDTADDTVTFSQIGVKMPLQLTSKKFRKTVIPPSHPSHLIVLIMASLAERFQAVTNQKTKIGFQQMSFEQLANQRISFGEAKINQKFQDVVEQDPKYTAWFVKKYEKSEKQAHQMFLHFINLYTERLELTLDVEPSAQITPLELRAKSKASRPEPFDVQSQDSWSDEDRASKPWSVVQEETSALMKEEMINQKGRIENMETALTQISRQLQALTQVMASQNNAQQREKWPKRS
eukprot:s274_g9.t1